MAFTLTFLENLLALGLLLWPLFLFLLFLIVLLGGWIGRLEKWPLPDSLYYAFITATTVGYGDFHPDHRLSKLFAVLIALIGLIATGILVAIAIGATEITIEHHYDTEKLQQWMRR